MGDKSRAGGKGLDLDGALAIRAGAVGVPRQVRAVISVNPPNPTGSPIVGA
jgi:hypothetical protein